MTTISRRSLAVLSLGGVACCLSAAYFSSYESAIYLGAWTMAQSVPMRSIRASLQEAAWNHWEDRYDRHYFSDEEIPIVSVQDQKNNLLPYLEQTYGSDWRKRPLLLRQLWNPVELLDDSRRLSLAGLLQENLTIPYFTDSRVRGALSPDGCAPVRDIVANISRGEPHKIGTQVIVQNFPEIIEEVAPVDIVTELFGNYFTADHVKGTGPFHLLPALTTVPVFVANGKQSGEAVQNDADTEAQPYTALHCEPIGNIAVQLAGKKQWTLVRPEFSFLIKPSTSPDGRAFFASWAANYFNVPTYTAVTAAGDAIWVPTWTWHRVDYIPSDDMAIGGSLFHFRVHDFISNNPLFAILLLPALILELVGYHTQ